VGESIQFSLDGSAIGSSITTNSLGKAVLKYEIPEGTALGTHSLSAKFAATSLFKKAVATKTINVVAGPVKVTVPAKTGAAGTQVTLSAKLRNASDEPLAGRQLEFTIDRVSVGTGTTNASGIATVKYSIPAGATGTVTVGVSFAGEDSHTAGNGTGTLTVS